jgi:predicted dehydrogenase
MPQTIIDRDRPFTAAVIGLGFVGAGDQPSGEAIGQQVASLDGTHAQALARHPRVRLVAGASRDEGRRRRFAERLGVARTYADWREMLASERPKIVSIATNTPQHAEIAVACAESSVRAVLCEKPIATRLVDGDRAVRACRERGTLLAINHNRRWHPVWRAARDLIREGAIGQVMHASVQWPTGRLGNVGTHLFDALHMLLGGRTTAVSGTLDANVPPDCRGPQFRDPGGSGVVWFDGGVKAFIDAPSAARWPMICRVVGAAGLIELRRDSAEIELWTSSGGRSPLPGVASDGLTSVDRAVIDIVECLTRGGGEPANTGEDGVAALEVVIGFHCSHRRRAELVSLPLSGADRELEVAIG